MATAWNTGYSSWWTYSNSNFSVKRNNLAQYYRNISANMKFAVGKYYIELKIEDAANGSYTGVSVGRNFTFVPPTGALGSDIEEWAYRANGDLIHGGTVTSGWGNSWTYGDVIGIAYQVTTQGQNTGKVWFSKNGVWQASGDPANGTNPAWSDLYGWGIYIMCWCGYYIGTKFTIVSDYQSQTYSPPSGFTDWDGNSAPAWTEKDFTASILAKGDIALAAQTYEESFVASFLANASITRALEVERSFVGNIATKGSFDGQMNAELSFASKVKASSFRNVDLFDYSAWLKNQYPNSILKYFLTLKEDNEDEGIDVSLINFDVTIRDGGYSSANATIPWGEIDAILEKNFMMEISYVYYIEGAENLRVKLISGKIDRIGINEPYTISVQAIFRFNAQDNSQTYDITTSSFIKEVDQYRIRIPEVNPFMRPGDKIKDQEDNLFPIESISYQYGPGYFISEVISNG